MQAFLAPLLAGKTVATTAATVLSAGSAIAGGIGAYGEAQGAKQAAQVNSYIGRTRAMQTDVSAREGLASELATIRSTLATNGQKPNVGTAAVMDELRSVRGKERRIEFGSQMQASADFRTQGKNAGRAGGFALAGGLLKAGPSLFDLYELKKKR